MDTWAIICSNYINAYSIVQSLRALNWHGPIVCIKPRTRDSVLTEVLKNRVQTWQVSLETPGDLLTALAERIPASTPKVFFFCDERFHQVFHAQASTLLPNSRYLLGSQTQLETILDRFAFYQFIADRGLTSVPLTIAGTEDPWCAFPKGFFVRPNRTWDGMRRLPRVKLARTSAEQRDIEAHFRTYDLEPEQWCYQEILSLSPKHNVSICGWHGPEGNLYFATHHLLRHPNAVGNGDVTEIMPAPADLLASTQRVLDALEYTGPFELEFVLDEATGKYKIIELNPRFWMQHGLIEAITGHALVHRYLGSYGLESAPELADTHKRYWVNTFYGFYRTLRGDGQAIRYLLNRASVIAPDFYTTLKYLPAISRAKITPMVTEK